MADLADFLRQAWPDCSSCHGTGLIRNSKDEVCHCVPLLILMAPEANELKRGHKSEVASDQAR